VRVTRVALIQTGGTIDSLGTDRLDIAWYTEAGKRLQPGELVAAVPELASIADVEESVFRRLPSHALTNADWLELAARVEAVLASDFDGVVVTHGTNTLEETAYFLSLVVRSDKPVVITGSMRPASAVSADGYLNLLNAVRVAASPAARGHGALVVLNDTIHSARDVTKTNTFRVETFKGRDLGPLGYADGDGQVTFWHRSLKQHAVFSLDGLDDLPRVDIVVSHVGADGTAVDAFVAAGARGIVSAGTGAGKPTPLEDAALDRAVAAGIVVVQGSRVGSGRVVRSPGLRQRQIVAADNLQPWKARVLLSLALTRTTDLDAIQRLFDTC
jgi:L-asparaginase